MKKILFDMKLIDRHYCFYLDDQDGKIHAYGVKLDTFNGYHVKRSNEIQFLNRILEKLNNKYIRRKDVLYKNEYYARYINMYNGKSYFARLTNGDQIVCPYSEAKDLYDFYNTVRQDCMPFERNKKKPNNIPQYNKDPFSGSYMPSSRRSYLSWRKNDFYAPSSIYKDEFDPHTVGSTTITKKKNNTWIKVLAVAGSVCVIGLSALGIKYLADGRIEQVEPVKIDESTPAPIVDEETGTKIEVILDTLPETEEELSLQKKYKDLEEQLTNLGLKPWQVAIELDHISLIQSEDDGISFYYDSKTNEVKFVFGGIEQLEQAGEKLPSGEKSPQKIPFNIEKIMNVIANNPNLTEEEKAKILEINLDTWIKDEKYLNINELIDRYSILEVTYDFQEDQEGASLDIEYTPYEETSGVYRYARSGDEIIQSEIILFNGSSLEDSLTRNKSVFPHEVNHVNGSLSVYGGGLLNEGYNSLNSKDDNNTYANEQLMAAMMIETFGVETMKEGFYSFDLESVLTNKIVALTQRDHNEVRTEIADLLDEIQETLFMTGDLGQDYRQNPVVIEGYQSIYDKLSKYYEIMNNGKKMKNNVITSTIMDYVKGTNMTGLLNEEEKFGNIRYNPDGSLEFAIVEAEKDVSYAIGWQVMTSPETQYKRSYTIKPADKENGVKQYKEITDENLDYLTR